MGIPMMGKLISRLGDLVDLKRHGKLVVDGSNALYWLFNRAASRDPNRADNFGGNMVELDLMLRQFFAGFLSQGVKLIVVYPGVAPSEQRYGRLASKALQSEKSSRTAMFLLQRNNFNWFVRSKLAQVALMRVVNELQLDHHPVQSAHETYPTLAHLAEQHDCPVLTSHADFILMPNVRHGFIKLDELSLVPPTATIRRYLKSSLLTHFSLQAQAAALPALLTLLRPDFAGRHWALLNQLLNITEPRYQFGHDDTVFVANQPRHARYRAPPGQLEHVLRNFPSDLRTMHQVRQAMMSYAPNDAQLLNDYDAITRSFMEPLSIVSPELGLVPAEMSQLFNITEILTRRETTAEFLVELLMGQSQFNRGNLEDTRLHWSTFSLADTARLFVMGRGGVGRLQLLDRHRDALHFRELAAEGAGPGSAARLNTAPDQMLYEMVFHFPPAVASHVHMAQWLEANQPNLLLRRLLPRPSPKPDEFVVVLMLIRFVFGQLLRPPSEPARLKRGPAQSPRRQRSPGAKPASPVHAMDGGGRPEPGAAKSVASGGKSGSLRSVSSQPLDPERYLELREVFARATYNCFLYYTFKGCHLAKPDERLNDRTKANTGEVHLIKLLIDEIDSDKVRRLRIFASNSDRDHIKLKTLIDGLSVAIDKYCQLNSMYNYSGVRLEFNKWYDGQLIYRIMRYLINLSPARQEQTSLLNLDTQLVDLLSQPS